ncbi:MAG: sortase [Chloroflexia bacterium]|nr:sortase [Chloroflexia bacterium]
MWQRITQRLQVVRSQRRAHLRNVAKLPRRRQNQRLAYLASMPTIVIAIVAILYLFLQSATIHIQEVRTLPRQSTVAPAPISNDATQKPVAVTPPHAGALVPLIPTVAPSKPQPITHIAIPAINLDSVVVEVAWDNVRDAQGQTSLVWQVAQYAVGHHYTSAYPGQPNNIVLSGHVGGYGKVFRNLNQLKQNDQIILTSGNQFFTYIVQQQIIVEELHASPSEQIANLSYIDSTLSETLTLITCWPPTGVDRFSKRLIIRAFPQHNQIHK